MSAARLRRALRAAVLLCLPCATPAQAGADAEPVVTSLEQLPACPEHGDDRKGDGEAYISSLSAVATTFAAETQTYEAARRFRIGTLVHPSCKRGDWIQVQLGEDSDTYLIRQDSLALTRPQAAMLLAELDALPAAATAAQRRDLAEGAVALAPTDVAALKKLIAVLEATDDSVALERARARRRELETSEIVLRADEPKAIFLPSGSTITPYAVLDHGAFKTFEAANHPVDGYAHLDERYYLPGRTFYAYTGQEVGTATVTRRDKRFCNLNSVDVEVHKVHGPAIVTNYEVAAWRKKAPRTDPTPAQLQTMERLGAPLLRRHNVPSTHAQLMLRQARSANGEQYFHALPVRDGGHPLLLVTAGMEYAAGQGRRMHYKFVLLASADKRGTYRVAYRDFGRREPEPHSEAADTFLLSVDLDGDGTDEIFTQTHLSEQVNTNMLQRVGGKWRQVRAAVGNGC